MSKTRGKHSKREMVVRPLMHGIGYRYGLHGKNLPGHPDLVFAARRKSFSCMEASGIIMVIVTDHFLETDLEKLRAAASRGCAQMV
jgi:hypothetical protein